MRLAAAALLLLATAFPATASADPFGRLPFLPVASAATCLRSTGVPGELARWTPAGIELLLADAGGLTPTAEVALGSSRICPEIAGRPNGAAVAAAVVKRGSTTSVRVAVRDPGGTFGAPVTLALPAVPVHGVVTAAVASSARGDALVAVSVGSPPTGPASVLAFRRVPGGAFGPPQTLATTKMAAFENVQAGADDAGGLTVAWVLGKVETLGSLPLEVAAAPPGGAFAAPQKLGGASTFAAPALAVAANGRALLAVAGDDGIRVAEREPGAASFGPPVVVGAAGLVGRVTLALADDGAAVLAWPANGTREDAVSVATRSAPGRFGPVRTASPGRPRPRPQGGFAEFFGIATSSGAPLDQLDVRAALAGDAFALAWGDQSSGMLTGNPEAATGALAGGPIQHQTLGSGVRGATSVAPLALADGRAAVAWSDGADAKGSERVHLAIAGAADEPAPAPPSLRPVAQARQRLYPDRPIAVRVRCGGACDVRATATGPARRARGGAAVRRRRQPRLRRDCWSSSSSRSARRCWRSPPARWTSRSKSPRRRARARRAPRARAGDAAPLPAGAEAARRHGPPRRRRPRRRLAHGVPRAPRHVPHVRRQREDDAQCRRRAPRRRQAVVQRPSARRGGGHTRRGRGLRLLRPRRRAGAREAA